jgi:DNA-binding transcriptional MerR regulator
LHQEVSDEMRSAQRREVDESDTQDNLTIGQLAHLTGITAKAIRYYESVGLLPHPPRGMNRYRRYSLADVNRLNLLRRIRLLGVPLAAARPLLLGATDTRCIEVRQELLALVDARMKALDQQIAELQSLRVEVEGYQQVLADCHPDEDEPFSACRDMSCLALSGETRCEEGDHGAM